MKCAQADCTETVEASMPLWFNLDDDGAWSVYGVGDEAEEDHLHRGARQLDPRVVEIVGGIRGDRPAGYDVGRERAMKNLDGLQTWGWHPMAPVGGVPANIFPTEEERRAAAERVRIKRALRVLLRTAGSGREDA